jgi:homocitrate synthase NifV
MTSKRVIRFRDATLREGLDTPGVCFSTEQRVRIARALEAAGVREAEVVAPSRVLADLEVVRELKRMGLKLKLSGLIYSAAKECANEIQESALALDRFDLLMPLSRKRAPAEPTEKEKVLLQAVEAASKVRCDFGVGFPHAFQADEAFVMDLAEEAVRRGGRRVTLYDTNGSVDARTVQRLVGQIKTRVNSELFFHGHNDLGMATANSLAAVREGADGLDVTVNGLGDRAGNAALEQVAAVLYAKGYESELALAEIRQLCATVANESGVAISKLAPVVGEYVYWHRSPSHLSVPGLFEAIDPELFGSSRKTTEN